MILSEIHFNFFPGSKTVLAIGPAPADSINEVIANL